MKKITLLAFAAAMLMGPAVANAQEVTYVEDPAQGYLFNSMKDNWFIQGEGGVGMMMSAYDRNEKFGHRLGAKAGLFIGKWFSPLLGVRLGGEFNQMKGATLASNLNNSIVLGARNWPRQLDNNCIPQHFNDVGIRGDVMFNLTNWICGYKPGRFYNAVVYAGGGVDWVYERENHDGKWVYGGNKDKTKDHDRHMALRAGLLNYFGLTKHLDLLLDLRFELFQEHTDGIGIRTWNEYPGVLLGLNYKFGKSEWNAPVVPVCASSKYSDAEGDALVARLAAADKKIADLEDQLRKCLQDKKPAPAPQAVSSDAPLATIYYPINRTEILGVQKNVVEAVAEVMANENNSYTLTGWADNYTGNDKINTRLRKGRVAGVKDALVAKGIDAGRLDTQINDGNLTNYGPKCASLDRAVTIHRK